MTRQLVTLALAAPVALGLWLGCNTLLGIDDAVFVPLDGGGATTGEGGPSGGPVMPSRRTVRVPRGETRTLPIAVDLLGKAGPAKLEADWPLPNEVAVSVAPEQPDRFVVTFVASGSATVDRPLVLRATGANGEAIGTTEIRVLVGAPGTLDVSFGPDHNGVVAIDAASLYSYGLLAHDRSILVVDERNKIWQIPEDGVGAKIAWGFAVSPDCTTSSLAADRSILVGGGDCPEFGFVGEAALDAPDSSVAATNLGDPSVYGAVRSGGATWLLIQDIINAQETSDVLRHPAGGSARIAIYTPANLLPRDGGMVAVGVNDLDSVIEIAQLDAPAPGAGGLPRDGGYFRIPVDGGLYPLASAAYSSNGTILAASPAADFLDDHVELRAIARSGAVVGFSILPRTIAVETASDARDRFLVVSGDGGAGGSVGRFFTDAGRDPGFAADLPGCSTADLVAPLATVDEDGMIIVRCGGGSIRVYRIWP
jgi:hypothetical protein